MTRIERFVINASPEQLRMLSESKRVPREILHSEYFPRNVATTAAFWKLMQLCVEKQKQKDKQA